MAVWGQPLILPQVLSVWTGPASPQVLSVWIRDRFSSCFVCVDQHPLLLRFCLCGSGPASPQVLSVWIRTQFSSGSVCGSGPGSPQDLSVWIRAWFSSGSVCVGQGPVLPQALSVSVNWGWFWSGSSAQCRHCTEPQLAHPKPRGCGAVTTFRGTHLVLQARALRCLLVWLSLGAED